MKYCPVPNNAATGHPDDQLSLKHKKDLFQCDGCKQVGFGVRYTCKEPSCSCGRRGGFHLHKGCAKPESKRTHPLYEGRIFEFRNEGNECKYCDACGGDFEGYFYQGYWDGKGLRERKSRDLHLCCIALEPVIHFSQFAEKEKSKKITEGNDEVPSDDISDLVLYLKKELPPSTNCALCHQKKVVGKKTWAYVPDCNTYGYHIHCLRSKALEWLETQSKLAGTSASDREEIGWVESFFGPCGSRTFQLPVAPTRPGKGAAAYGPGVSRAMNISKIVVAIVVAAFIGDPVSAVVAAFTAAVSQ